MDNLIFFLNDAHQSIYVHVQTDGQCGIFDWNVHFWSVLNFSIIAGGRRTNLSSFIIRCRNFYVDSENKWKKISAIHLIFNSTLALSRKHSGKWNVGNKSAWMYTTIIDLSPLCVINLSNPVARENFGSHKSKNADEDYHDLKKVSHTHTHTHACFNP